MRIIPLCILLTMFIACSKSDLPAPFTPDPGNSEVIMARCGCIGIELDENASDTSLVIILDQFGDTIYFERHMGNPIFIDSIGFKGKTHQYKILADRTYEGSFTPDPLIDQITGTYTMDIEYRYQDGGGVTDERHYPSEEVTFQLVTDPYLDVEFLDQSTRLLNTAEWSDCTIEKGNYTITNVIAPARFEYWFTNYRFDPHTDSLWISYKYTKIGVVWEYSLSGKME